MQRVGNAKALAECCDVGPHNRAKGRKKGGKEGGKGGEVRGKAMEASTECLGLRGTPRMYTT